MQVNQSEASAIEAQIQDLEEVEALQEDWQLQAEAKDDLERLLRSSV